MSWSWARAAQPTPSCTRAWTPGRARSWWPTGPWTAQQHSWSGSPRWDRGALVAADVAVNATTVGMIDPGATIPVDGLRADATVFDLVYVPAETPLVAAARARGLRAANGSEMLIAQAAIAFERWTGVGGMADVMRQAVAPLLADPTVRA
jgi:shikimate dehydrogenase